MRNFSAEQKTSQSSCLHHKFNYVAMSTLANSCCFVDTSVVFTGITDKECIHHLLNITNLEQHFFNYSYCFEKRKLGYFIFYQIKLGGQR